MRRSFASAILAVLVLGTPPAVSHSEVYAAAEDVYRERRTISLQLVQPIARCVKRNDTDHAVFHGCMDWHSAVHGMLGLVLFGKISGDARYDAFIQEQLTEPKLARERTMLRSNPGFEMPYG